MVGNLLPFFGLILADIINGRYFGTINTEKEGQKVELRN